MIICKNLTFTTLWANSVDDKLCYFSYFSQKIVFDISCKLSPWETICMKSQTLFSNIIWHMHFAWKVNHCFLEQNNRNIPKCLPNFLPSIVSIKSLLGSCFPASERGRNDTAESLASKTGDQDHEYGAQWWWRRDTDGNWYWNRLGKL